MAGRMRTSQTGIDLITRFEGFRERSEPLSGGGHVIGYGHTRHAKASQKITEGDALTLLKGHDLPPIEKALAARCLAPLSQNEFDALVAFAFNIGLDNFLDSDVFALVNSGAKLNAAEAMAAWRKARVDGRVIVVDALVRRRAAERALFLEVEGGPTTAATPLVRPILDLATAILHPREPLEPRLPAEEYPEEGEEAEDVDGLDDDNEASDLAGDEAGAPDARPSAKAAGRDVSARITRILGEEASGTDADEGPSEESVEEITRAVSAIADPVDDNDEAAVAPAREGRAAQRTRSLSRPSAQVDEESADDPVAAAAISALTAKLRDEVPELQEIREDRASGQERAGIIQGSNGSGKPHHGELEEIEYDDPVAGRSLVDDLEPLELDASATARAPGRATGSPWGSLLLYGLSAFGGALIGAWGIHDLLGTMASTVPLESDWALYAGPFAMLVGGLIFLIMGYYLLRAIFSEG